MAEGKRRHREGSARLGRKLGALGALRDDSPPSRAAALIAVLTWHPAYAQLTQEHGWSFDDCEQWITTTLERALLR
jgi:hypothetical protein